MILKVVGSPYIEKMPTTIQRIIATYDPKTACTTICCDVDIVTLGIAVNVLQYEYEKYLMTFEPDTAEDIRTTIKEVVEHERY